MKFLLYFVVFLIVKDSRTVIGDTSNTYRAAVVEYNILNYESIHDEVTSVLADYLDMIKAAKKNGADIIVFPELAINSRLPIIVPDENERVQPWKEPGNYSNILYKLSKSAYNERIYVVVNVAEKALNDTDADSEKYLIFNTNFVLDRNGTVVSRYRKINLFGEPSRNSSIDHKLGVFETDFGVKFGHFICFDLLYQRPALEILHKENVSNIIYPSMWYSELPFLTAVQIQESWAFLHNINLLAAGSNNPAIGSTGTGIYSGKRGRLTAVMHTTSKSEILYADVPKNSTLNINSDKKIIKKSNEVTKTMRATSSSSMDELFLMKYNLTVHNSVILNKSGMHKIKHGNVTCFVNITFSSEQNAETLKYTYRAVAFDGIRWFTFVTGGVSECGVVACTNANIASCATRFANHSEVWPKNTISSIELRSTVPEPIWNESISSMDRVYYPVTLDASIMPISVEEYDYATISNEGGFVEIIMKISDLEDREDILLSFGITGRVFERDGLPTNGGTIAIFVTGFAVLLVTFVISTYGLFS